MVLVEIVLFAILLIAVVYFRLRLDMLEQQMQHLRAQLAYQRQRVESTSIVSAPPAMSSTSPALAVPSAGRRLSEQPFLRLVKNR